MQKSVTPTRRTPALPLRPLASRCPPPPAPFKPTTTAKFASSPVHHHRRCCLTRPQLDSCTHAALAHDTARRDARVRGRSSSAAAAREASSVVLFMGSALDQAGGRPKKGSGGSQLWKKALLHSSLCFVMGFFTGFAPSSLSDWRSAAVPVGAGLGVGSSHVVRTLHSAGAVGAVNRSLLAQGAAAGDLAVAGPRPLLVVVTTTESTPTAAGERAAMLTRMAHTLRQVPPPLLWVVVEAAPDVPATARLLRDTGILYRHLTYKDNFTAAEAAAGKERHHQRNAALEHIERHRLAGVVHFAGLSDVFELRFFDQLRQISTLGAWPVARMSQNERKVVVQGPACSASKVIGWFSRDVSSSTTVSTGTGGASAGGTGAARSSSPEIDVHGFAFNSSVLWDPERWGRYPTSEPDKSQDSIRFVQQVVTEDYSKVKGIPSDCSEIMVWHVDAAPSSSRQTPGSKSNRR